MISHKYKFIFIHIQKTAGKSILNAFDINSGADHRYASDQLIEYGQTIWDSYFKFAFVRNPWDRLVSGYEYRKKGGNGSPNDLKRSKLYPSTFYDFCLQLDDFISLKDELMFSPQYKWIYDKHGKLMVDYIGRFENIDHDFGKICHKLNIHEYSLPHINKTKHRPYFEYFNNETRKIVSHLYKEDIELFNYSF